MSLPLRGFKPPGRLAPVPSAFSSALLLLKREQVCRAVMASVHLPVRGVAPGLFEAPVSWVWSRTDVHSLSRLWSLLCDFASFQPSWLTKVMPVELTQWWHWLPALLWPLAFRAWMWLCHMWPLSSPVFLSLNHVSAVRRLRTVRSVAQLPSF